MLSTQIDCAHATAPELKENYVPGWLWGNFGQFFYELKTDFYFRSMTIIPDPDSPPAVEKTPPPPRVSCRPVLGGETPPKNQLLPPKIFTDFIFIHPEPPTLGYSPQSPSTPPAKRWNPAGNPAPIPILFSLTDLNRSQEWPKSRSKSLTCKDLIIGSYLASCVAMWNVIMILPCGPLGHGWFHTDTTWIPEVTFYYLCGQLVVLF